MVHDIGKYLLEQVWSTISISLYGQHTFYICPANTYFIHDEASE